MTLKLPLVHRRCTVALLCLLTCLALHHGRADEDGPGLAGWQIDNGSALFLPSGMSPAQMPPSLALAAPLRVAGPLPSAWSLRPQLSRTGTGKVRVVLDVPEGTSLYGEGEVTGPLLRNGTSITLWNTDNGAYKVAGGRMLYQSHPWVLGVRRDGSAFGFLADSTWRADLNLTHGIEFISDGPPCPVLVLEGASPQAVLSKLAGLTGTLPLPPRWALGYHQCRWTYSPDARVRQVADEFRARRIPCDVIWEDIDYMDGFRDFTFDPTRFPDPKATNDYLHAHGFHSVWMIDPGVKAEPGYRVYDSGEAAAVWVKNAQGQEYHGRVWPGPCAFPDFTRPATRAWWSGLYRDFLAQGVDGVWNDMNEPAVFDGPDHTMPVDCQHAGGDGLPAGTEAQYHNVFGMLEVRATREGLAAANPTRRPFVLSRANFLGGQRYAACWTGDNTSSWEHLKLSIPMSLSLGLSGQPMSGPDIGGFDGVASPDLWAHWIAVGAFYPFARGHASRSAPPKEPWAFGEETERAARLALERRYRLLPYLYTLYAASERDGLPVMRPVFFAAPADAALRAEQAAFLVGADLLVVPRWAEHPALPPGNWRPCSLVPGDDAPGEKYQPEVRLRPGAILPLGRVVQSTTEESLDPLTLLVSLDAHGLAEGTLYEDAGDSYAYRHGLYRLTTYRAERAPDNRVTLRALSHEGMREHPPRGVVVRVLTDRGVVEGQGLEDEGIEIKLPDE
jgi:alpha-glucosidase